mmetsp:Transcript_3423/g.5805  ORF Transcript_3423/g.5805 Transcript_3423/m.5805 type:complete len:81 (-) Transcript_3423:541-783(-)
MPVIVTPGTSGTLYEKQSLCTDNYPGVHRPPAFNLIFAQSFILFGLDATALLSAAPAEVDLSAAHAGQLWGVTMYINFDA